ncbi:diguanylate cyclase (GGDEF) domain-containing protein [Eubacterium oxidoreducens]|uniref:Diguanylate cyclase (GGDEF) domain-containing protein n=2 Tax=Eubacterium oxidoreducens TaxID=1732 RepID=A0A1G6BN98_EUBOX|nr:diguanylate cyclase (GGDEF) domain-containing protein [Eubacterium oxidoreducens]
MTTIIITAEVVSALFLVIILMGSYLGRGESSSKKRTSYFQHMAIWTIVSLLTDAISYALEGKSVPDGIIFGFTLVAFLLLNVLIWIFARYASAIITEKGHLFLNFDLVILGLCIADVVFEIVASFAGKLFFVQDHKVVYGSWQGLFLVFPIVCVVIILGTLIYHNKAIGKKSCMVLCSYMIWPFLALFVEHFILGFDVTYVGISLSVMMVHVFMQDNIITEIKMREEILTEVSAMDTLTGLYNRRSYEKFLKAMDSELEVGVIFCDINGLKYANDNYGHEAGDRLICSFAEVLKERFEAQGIFRISGDEFVIFSLSTVKRKFDDDVRRLKADVVQHDGIASIGWAYGSSDQIEDLIKASERIMYQDKEQYYRTRRISKRR